MKKKIVNTLLFGMLCPALLLGQGETDNWYFGNGAGITFNDDGSVTPLTDGRISTLEGCATISDPLGGLLFYTDGITVYNRNHQIMENGQGLNGDPSSTQSALIVPRPDHPNLYYIFTVDTSVFEGDPDFGLNYSVVDISADNGRGSVIEKNRRLLQDCSEKVTAVLKDCSDRSIWVITLASENGTDHILNTYHAFEVNANGVITTSVKSTFTDLAIEDPRGYLKLSPDGSKLVSANANFGLYMYDFDATTGILTDQERITTSSANKNPYGVEFSPNGQYLYIHSSNDILGPSGHASTLSQYDLRAGDVSASEVVLDSRSLYRGALQLGDNGKIYRTLPQNYLNGSSFLGVIENPNEKGLGANYVHNAISLSGRTATQGLPPFIQSFFNKIDLIVNADGSTSNSMAICESEGFILQTDEIANASYNWEKDGVPLSTTSSNFLEIRNATDDDSGRYRLVITSPELSCPIIGESSIEIVPMPTTPNLILEQCDVYQDSEDGLALLNLRQVEAENDFEYQYFLTVEDRINGAPIDDPLHFLNTVPFEQTIYYRAVNDLGCENMGELQLRINPVVFGENEQTTFYSCDEDPYDTMRIGIFDLYEIGQANYPNNEVNFYESLEDVSLERNELPLTYATETNVVYARIENANQCQDVIEISLVVNAAPFFSMSDSYLLCTNDPDLTISAPEGFDSYTFSRIEGDTEEVISTNRTTPILETGEYVIEAGYEYSTNGETTLCTNRVKFKVLPSNNAIIDNVLISDISSNNTVQIEVAGDGAYEFSIDGDKYQDSNFFENIPPGFITIYIRDKNGCGITEELISVVGYPKFFTPNNDGFNDNWQLIGVDGRFRSGASIAIFDRFGKQVAEIDAGSKGWDGTFNSRILPASDYWFKAILENGKEFKGHFTLKR
ncbi:T9SS type B sorting domain-containing protein [Maribacter algicola]|uniref:T9SS type B sorting domain-containing protein n=1 Tax=Meishania litoralis TaxID=3434685 RepID=A0ACC7LF68_9FLAO